MTAEKPVQTFLPKQRKTAISQIPLQDRLKRIHDGYTSVPAFAPHAILTMANTTLPEFFGDDSLLEDFSRDLWLSDEEARKMTFQEAAGLIYRICMDKDAYGKRRHEIECSIADLAIPRIRFWEGRRHLYAKSQNPTNERPKPAPNDSSHFLAAYELLTADVSSEIYKITGNSLLPEHYREHIQQYAADEDTNTLYFLSQFFYIHTSDELLLEESLKLKYYVLIEPFALLYEHERKQQKEKTKAKNNMRTATAAERRTIND